MLAFTRAIVQEVEIIQEKRRHQDVQGTPLGLMGWATRLRSALWRRMATPELPTNQDLPSREDNHESLNV